MNDKNTGENITFFFEDTAIDDLEDNALELEKMLQEFDVDYDDNNINNISDDMKEMVDSNKIKEIQNEIKELKKAKAKFEKAAEKKAAKKAKKSAPKEEDVVTDAEIEEAPIDETDIMAEMGDKDPANDPELKAAAEKNDKEYNIMNESFIRMQKIAGIIK
jgi:hypothetical protein